MKDTEGKSKRKSSKKRSGKKRFSLNRVKTSVKNTIHLIRTSSRFRHGTMATVMTAVFFVFVVLLNLIVMKLADRYSFMSIDMTEDKRYTLTDATLEMLDGVNETVEIDILATEEQCSNESAELVNSDYYGQIPVAHEIIKRYAQANDNITINYVDLSKMPAYVLQFPEYSNVLDYYSIVVKSKRRTRVTSFYEMLPSLSSSYVNYDSTAADESVAQSYTETYMTSLIKTVTMDKTPIVAFVDGLNVDGNSADLVSTMQLNGYDVQVVDIRKDEFPENTDIVMIAAPTTDINQAQMEKLDSYLNDAGGSKTLLLFSSSIMPELPNFSALLSEYGLSITQDIVYEGDSSNVISTNMSAFTAQMQETDYTNELLEQSNYPAVMSAVALDVLYETKGNTEAYPILTSSSEAYVCDASKPFDKSKYTEADKEARTIMAASTTYRDTLDGSELRTDIIVAPDSLYNIEFLGSDIYGNMSLLLNVVNRRSGIDTDNVDIEAKSLYAVDFSVDIETLSVLSMVFCYVIPLAVLIFGFVIYFRRKRL